MPVDAESARTFAKFDTDGSGSISWRELHEMLKEIGLDGDAPHAKVRTLLQRPSYTSVLTWRAVAQAVLARYDKNHDGTLNLAEFDGLVKTISYAAGADATVRGEVEITAAAVSAAHGMRAIIVRRNRPHRTCRVPQVRHRRKWHAQRRRVWCARHARPIPP